MPCLARAQSAASWATRLLPPTGSLATGWPVHLLPALVALSWGDRPITVGQWSAQPRSPQAAGPTGTQGRGPAPGRHVTSKYQSASGNHQRTRGVQGICVCTHTCYMHTPQCKGTPPTSGCCVDTCVCTQLTQNEHWAFKDSRPGFKSSSAGRTWGSHSASKLSASPGGMSTRTAPPPDFSETQQ